MVNPSDESKPDLDQLKSKMVRFPEEILMAQLNPLSTNQAFRPGMENYEFQIAKTNLEDRVNQFQALFTRSVTQFNRTDDTDLDNQLERKLVDVLRSSCSPEFLKQFGRDLASEKTFNSALNFISDVFGSETEEERREDAKGQLEKLARRTDQSEKFVGFLKRIRGLAGQIVDKADAVDFIVNEKFRKMIEPANITFLKNNCFYHKSADEIAQFLDERERHMIAQVSAVGADQLNSFMDETGELLNKQLAAIYDNNRKIQKANEEKNAEFSAAIKELTAKISELTVAKQAVNSNNNVQNFGQNQNAQNFAPPSFQPGFPAQNQRFSSPYQNFPGQNNFQNVQNFQGQSQNQGQVRFQLICNHCGRPGHSKRKCRLVTCFLCNTQGHVQKDCPKFPQKDANRGSNNISGNA